MPRETLEQMRRRFIRETEQGIEALRRCDDVKAEWARLMAELRRFDATTLRFPSSAACANPSRPAA